MTNGIHHVTALTRRVQANVDFYTGFLGLRLVKRTGGFEDAEQLHLFYGDAAGSPGSLVTFLVWEDGAAGRTGLGQVGEIALAVPRASIGEWLTRAMTARIPATGPAREFGETVLRLKDPDGITVKLVGADLPATAPLPDPIAPTRLRSVTLLTDQPQATADFLTRFGYRPDAAEGNIRRMLSDRDVVDVRDATGYFPGIPGTGIIDHVAFRAADADALRRTRLALAETEGLTNVHDRKYFLSLYVRDPAGILIEQATDGPGFLLDEPMETLGTRLFVPPHDTHRAQDLRVILPQFALPGEERTPMRDLPFVHRFHRPEDPDGRVFILLHGTGGNESDLMPLAARIAPRATLLGLRGRSTEEGINRWFRRFDAMTYDQADIRAESAALAGFAEALPAAYGIDPADAVWLGYSNGANLLGAAMRLHPGVVRRAVMLRGIEVLEEPPTVSLPDTSALLLSGARDPYARLAPALENSLRAAGVNLESHNLPAGHELSEADLATTSAWLAQNA